MASRPLSPREQYTRRRAAGAGAGSPTLSKSCAACGTIGHATEDCPHMRGRAVVGNEMYDAVARAMSGRCGRFGAAQCSLARFKTVLSAA